MWEVLRRSYFKTTLYGLSGCAPDYVMLMVGGNAGLIGMSKEHLGVALALNVPIAVCVTKVSTISRSSSFPPPR
jgi:GTPase